MEPKNKRELKGRILRLLSVDARISMQDLANSLKTTKVNAYGLFNEVSNEYQMRFVPEIRIDKLWKWEFIKRARLRTKRGILEESAEELPTTGFGEYIVFVKFKGKEPKNEEIIKAMGNSYIPQFAARMKGDYDLMIYAIARSYEDAIQFVDSLSSNLSKYPMLTYTTRTWSSFGFFPLNKKLIEQFDIFDTYKNLLIGLSNTGRSTFTEIGKEFNQGAAQMLYAYDRLVRTEIVRRMTYFEAKPNNSVYMAILLKIQNPKSFDECKCTWFKKLLKKYENEENECVFMCDMPSPKSMLVIASLSNNKKAESFLSGIRSSLKSVEMTKMRISKVLYGNLGIRDFDMRYTFQYKSLERKGMVPSLKEKSSEIVIEDPNAL